MGRVEVFVVEAGPFAEVAIVGLELGRDIGIGDQRIDAPAVLLHDREVDLLGVAEELRRAHVRAPGRILDGRVVLGPAVVGQVGIDRPAEHDRLEVVHPGLLPARPQSRGEGRVGRPVTPHTDRRRCALKHVHLLGGLGERRQAQPAGTGPDQCDGLVAELCQRFTGRAAGVAVIPAGGVEPAAPEVVHSGDCRQLHQIENPDSQNIIAAG